VWFRESMSTLVTPEPSIEDINLEELSSEQLRSFFGSTDQDESYQDPQPIDMDDPDPDSQPIDMDDPDPDSDADPVRSPEPGPKQRIRPKNSLDQQVVDLYKSEGFQGTFQEAVDVIYGKTQPADASGGSTPEPSPGTGGSDAINKLQGEIAALETQIDEAADDMDTAKALRLQRELLRKENEIARIEQQRRAELQRQEDAEADSYRQQAANSWQSATIANPALADPNSVDRKAFEAFKAAKEVDPAYAPIFASPKWPEILVREFVAQSPAARTPAVSTQNPARPNNATKVLSTGGPSPSLGAQTPGKITQATIVNNLSKLSTDALRGLLSR
jgi:hypothetical protein